MKPARLSVAIALTVVAVLLVACEAVIENRVNALRTSLSLPALRGAPALVAAARAKSTAMCAAGAATPTPDPQATYGDAITPVAELVASAVLPPGQNANLGATNAIWDVWKTAATLVDPRWNEMGVAEVACADGRLYMTLLLRRAAPGVQPDGRTSLFMGQELGAVGGFPGDHDQGYVDHVGMPVGVTFYTDITFLWSLRQRVDLGSGDLCGQCYLDNSAFDDAMTAIGLYMVNDLANVVSGQRDANITALATFIKEVDRPVLLRIGYEFDGSWNAYDPTLYQQAFRRIMDRLRAEGATKVASVWQASGSTTNKTTLLRWYPGDEYVDWVGYSYFRQSNPSGGIMAIARERRKPIMIAEATPQRNLSLGDPIVHWDTWFAPFFQHVHTNQDVIKAVAYINTRWFDQPAWNAGWGDSRVQIRPEIKARWIAEMQQPIWAAGDFANAANQYVLTPHDLTPP
ncbi:MAG TPA: glycosyl hydrolase [Candidatus Binatia bacterium]|jgi:hypothetical protein|nr:glycosyl hydrolase [Candidatus Binatia bacterium]